MKELEQIIKINTLVIQLDEILSQDDESVPNFEALEATVANASKDETLPIGYRNALLKILETFPQLNDNSAMRILRIQAVILLSETMCIRLTDKVLDELEGNIENGTSLHRRKRRK